VASGYASSDSILSSDPESIPLFMIVELVSKEDLTDVQKEEKVSLRLGRSAEFLSEADESDVPALKKNTAQTNAITSVEESEIINTLLRLCASGFLRSFSI
jgi:hypothetical protein